MIRRTKINFLFLISILIFTGCEIEETISPDSIQDEYTVVQAEIRAGEFFPAVRFTRTLPIGVPFSIEQVELKNITAYLKKNGVQIIPLIYVSEGFYKPLDNFYVEAGDTYELYAQRDEVFIYGKTTVPHNPVVTSVSYNQNDYYFAAEISAGTDQVYGAIWIISMVPPAIPEDFYSITETVTMQGTKIVTRTSSIPEEYLPATYNGKRYIQVYAFDKSFREYFYSRNSGEEISDPFIQGGGSVKWNVQGEKVIGMFIGVTAGSIINVN